MPFHLPFTAYLYFSAYVARVSVLLVKGGGVGAFNYVLCSPYEMFFHLVHQPNAIIFLMTLYTPAAAAAAGTSFALMCHHDFARSAPLEPVGSTRREIQSPS
jgi:hypothetical protein